MSTTTTIILRFRALIKNRHWNEEWNNANESLTYNCSIPVERGPKCRVSYFVCDHSTSEIQWEKCQFLPSQAFNGSMKAGFFFLSCDDSLFPIIVRVVLYSRSRTFTVLFRYYQDHIISTIFRLNQLIRRIKIHLSYKIRHRTEAFNVFLLRSIFDNNKFEIDKS